MDRDFEIDEVVAPDGRYVLYYRWPDEPTDDDAGEEDQPAAETDV